MYTRAGSNAHMHARVGRALKEGRVLEVFGAGTAAVVAPVNGIGYNVRDTFVLRVSRRVCRGLGDVEAFVESLCAHDAGIDGVWGVWVACGVWCVHAGRMSALECHHACDCVCLCLCLCLFLLWCV
jgi:hypothetical protein